MNNFQRVFRNTSYLFVAEVFLKLLGVLWFIFLARVLTVELLGRYNLVNSFVSVFSFLPDLGIGLVLIREIAKNRNKASSYIGSSLLINSVLAVVTIGVIVITTYMLHYSQPVQVLVCIAAFTLFFSTLRSVAIFYFDGTENLKLSAFLTSFNSICMLAGGFLAIVLGFDLPGVFLGMLVGTILSLGVTWKNLLSRVTPSFSFDKEQIKHIVHEGLPLGLAAFSDRKSVV